MQEVLNTLVKKGQNKIRSVRRSRNKLNDWIANKIYNDYLIYFATFTFVDADNFNRKQFTDYLRRVCKIKCYLFADYGVKNNRFHLHGVVAVKEQLDLKVNRWNKFGFTKIKKCNINVSLYIVKYSVKFLDDVPTFRAIRIN